MRTADWIVMAFSLASVIFYGLWRSRGAQTTKRFMLA